MALPTVVGCLAAAVLLALPDGILTPGVAAALLTVLYAVALVVGSAFDTGTRTATARVAALAAVSAVLLLAADGDRQVLAAHLAVQGAFTLGWAWRTGAGHRVARGRRPARGGRLGVRGGRRPAPRRVVHAVRGRRAADRSRAIGSGAARRGRRGGRRCWWPSSRRPHWRSSHRTAPARWACWWPPRPLCCSARWPGCGTAAGRGVHRAVDRGRVRRPGPALAARDRAGGRRRCCWPSACGASAIPSPDSAPASLT